MRVLIKYGELLVSRIWVMILTAKPSMNAGINMLSGTGRLGVSTLQNRRAPMAGSYLKLAVGYTVRLAQVSFVNPLLLHKMLIL